MLFAKPLSCAFSLALSVAMVSSAWAAESARQAPLELPKELMPAEAVAPKKPMAKPIKLAKADIPPEPSTAAVATPVTSASKPVVQDMAAPVWKTHTVVAGDTLDKVVQKYYANSPLKIEVLRDWVVVNNPTAFTKANSKKLQPGTVLTLADQAELIQKLMPSPTPSASTHAVPNSPSPNPLPPPVGGAAAHQAGNIQALVEPNKRHWVRYP